MTKEPGILWALTAPFEPKMTDEVWNEWYSTKHTPDVVESGIASFGVRYKNQNPSAKWTYLALYRFNHIKDLYNQEVMAKQNTDSPLGAPGEGYMPDVAKVEMIGYEPMEKSGWKVFQNQIPKVLVSVDTEPEQGDEQYLSKSAEILDKEEGHGTSQSYKSLGSIIPKEADAYAADRGFLSEKPAQGYLALHDFAKLPSGAAEGPGTDVWEYIMHYGSV